MGRLGKVLIAAAMLAAGTSHAVDADAVASPALAYRPLASSVRPYDTRIGTGAPVGKVMAGTTRDVDLGLADPDLRAVLVNLTMVEPEGSGFLVASSDTAIRPPTSNVNATTGEVVANAAIVQVDARGHIAVFSSVTTDVVVDVMGVFDEVAPGQSGGRYTPRAPRRLVDTRDPITTVNNFSSATVGHQRTVTAPVAGKVGVPTTVQAVALIVTGIADPDSGAGYVTVYPGGTGVPPTSNLNVNGRGDIRPNLVIAPLGADGTISLVLKDVGHVVIDVVGYFLDSADPTGSYHVFEPDRQIDTRIGRGFSGTLRADQQGAFTPGVSVPSTATAISQNITMTNTTGPGFVTSYPDSGRPLASNVNSTGPDQNRASLSLTGIGVSADWRYVVYYTSVGTDLVVDVTGYFE